MHVLLCASYFAVLLLLSMYGLHRSHLVLTCLRHARALRSMKDEVAPLALDVPAEDVPHVTIQLPLYNEATVAARLLEHISKIEYPREKLEIQVLDDSTDETRALVRSLVAQLRDTNDGSAPLDIVYIHRVDRTGYKAGALDAGLKVAKGELVAVFDADFLPQPDFLRSLAPHFIGDPKVGMVQARWGHMNREHSLLTRTQALMLDGHHLVENRARSAAGWLFNFSGTGGMWRKEAIWSSGGWQHDTLTEDLDLSYRAQLAGWRFIYRESVVTPAELPEDVSAFRAQQFRWAKGTVQTARKLLKRVMTAPLSPMQRIEAFFHLTPHFAYPLMVFLSVLLLPALILMPATNPRTMLMIDLPLCIGTTGSLAAFYTMAMTAQGRSRWSALKQLPALLALGAGLAPHLTKAVVEGLQSMAGEFVRTPKKGVAQGRYRARADIPMIEIGLCLVSLGSTVASVETGHWFATPFAMLFTFGYGYVASLVASEELARRSAASKLALAGAAPESVPPPAPSRGDVAEAAEAA
ncbi:MAG TPA: glycosyltransferase [Polyangiaceae bacterium]|jgi:cellulose synthase/poly-beta-1,6-N-acetylglucosamine synthase-like glycosyltransferase